MTVTYFVSGHMDLSRQEFLNAYVPSVLNAVAKGARFVVGDAPGVDEHFQRLMRDAGLSYLVTVYHMFDKPRNWVCNHHGGEDSTLRGGFRSDEERDSAMTADSHYDIAFIKHDREKSGTAKNIIRRATLVGISDDSIACMLKYTCVL